MPAAHDPRKFAETMNAGYACKGGAIELGAALLDGKAVPEAKVRIPLRTLNRHGLIAGATGTGKTKTLMGMAEALSDAGVPCLLMDVKGDLSGLAVEGTPNERIEERHRALGMPWEPRSFPVEFLTLSNEPGARLRATVSEFGPVLFSKILGLNETQEGVASILFKYCDDTGLPLLDLEDVKKTLRYMQEEGQREIEAAYGKISATTLGTIQRKVVELEQQGANVFFGEPSFDVEDLLRIQGGRGTLSIVRLTDLQDKPRLFSTFMLSLLSEIYSAFPELGDPEKPKLMLFIDEAHLVFEEATPALLNQIETVVKLIRSKGVGVVFCTQNPMDIPRDVLAQLGFKIQHALRAFTAKDRKDIKLISENYPDSPFYAVDELLTGLGIGEAGVTCLSERGIPTPLAATLLAAPRSRMGVLSPSELSACVAASPLASKYARTIDRESAAEILGKRLQQAGEQLERARSENRPLPPPPPGPYSSAPRRPGRPRMSMGEVVAREAGRVVVREVARGLLGALFGGRRRLF